MKHLARQVPEGIGREFYLMTKIPDVPNQQRLQIVQNQPLLKVKVCKFRRDQEKQEVKKKQNLEFAGI